MSETIRREGVLERFRVHANGAVTGFLELRCEEGEWSTVRYWIDEFEGLEERGDHHYFDLDEAAARADFATRAHEGLSAPIAVSTAPSLLDPATRFPELLDRRLSPAQISVELRRGPEGLALLEDPDENGRPRWSLWGEEERAAADTFRRLAAGLGPMPPLAEPHLYRYRELVERVPLSSEGLVECSLELRRGSDRWAVVELREYPISERWSPERIEWREFAEEGPARSAFAARRTRLTTRPSA